ncbi:MAG: hypothetical protein EOP06_09595 [Proteobacteria bacterium]|nr:MAG: hypothetical protein EOP06_09595 [Pseudomonadota bacterium]
MTPISKHQITIFGSAALVGGALLGSTLPAIAQQTPAPENQSFLKAVGIKEPRLDLTREVLSQQKTDPAPKFTVQDEGDKVERRNSCQSHLKSISLCLIQYAMDNDEKFPDAEKWIDKLQPYFKSEQLFTCPSVTEPEGYGYAFNMNLSLQSTASIKNDSQPVSIYETTILERNSSGAGDDPAFRHLDGANYAYADGHVKWLSKTEIPSFEMKQK